VVGLERFGGRPSGNGMHHRRLHLNVIALGKEASNAIEDLCPNQKCLFDLGVDDEVEGSAVDTGPQHPSGHAISLEEDGDIWLRAETS